MNAPARDLARTTVHAEPMIDGLPARTSVGGRFRRTVAHLLVSAGEREEAELEARLRSHPGVTRPNVIAVISPKGGVGKTTSTFLIGNLLSSHLKLRTMAVDANPDFGTLERLAPDRVRAERSLADLLHDSDRLLTAAELAPYVSRLPTGLHLLGAPRDPEALAGLGPERYGELVAYLSCFYEVVLLDLGTGVGGPLARFAVGRADQTVLVTTPEWVTNSVVIEALEHLPNEQTTVAINKSIQRGSGSQTIEARFRSEHLHRCVTLPYDDQLASMLDTATYGLGALERRTRVSIKRLGLAAAERLV